MIATEGRSRQRARTRERAERAVALIEVGNSQAVVARELGYHETTFSYWWSLFPDLYERVQVAATDNDEWRQSLRAAERLQQRARPRAARKQWTDGELIALVQEASVEIGNPLSSLRFRDWLAKESDRPSYRTFTNRLGRTWAEVCARCGIKPAGGRKPVVTRAACEGAVVRVAGLLGRPPQVVEYEAFRRSKDPCGSSVIHHLGEGRWTNVVAKLVGSPLVQKT